MLNQYKNIEQILKANGSVSAQRYSDSDILDFKTNIQFDPSIVNSDINSRIELHVYNNENWITGNHNVSKMPNLPVYTDKLGNPISFISTPIGINLYEQLNNLKLNAGQLRIVVNFFKNLIGSYDLQYLKIQEISPDRTEIALRATDITNPDLLQQITNFAKISFTGNDETTTKTYILNFSRNKTAVIINAVVVGSFVYLKLYDPLPDDIELNFRCWINEEQKQPYVDNISIIPFQVQPELNALSGPNWQAYSSYDTSYETEYKNWTDLLGSSLSTSQQIINAYFSGSLSGMNLNIDYSDFNNFIFYSLATERLENYKYKLELLEHLTEQSSSTALLNGSVPSINAIDYKTQIDNLIGGFDGFEQYLYLQSSSKLTTHYVPSENPNVTRVTGSYITPSPKITSTYPYTLTPTTSSQFQTWYSSSYEYAKQYDIFNGNSLYRALPEYIRLNDDNQDMVTFVNMLGHHYDILYTYINHMTDINKREENPKLGMPNELLYSVAKQFGWSLTNGNQNKELWQYVLGTNEAGTPLTGSNSIGDPAVSAQNMTYNIWRRIVNNLPLLLKSKGTKRSIQALLSCYGIPQSIISLKEYGGPRLERAPVYEKLNFDYALDLISSTAGTVTVDYTQPINAVELRFRTDNIVTNPLIPTTMNLFNIGSNSVTVEFSSGNKGQLKINGTGSGLLEIYNNEWLNTLLRVNGSNLDLIVKKSKYGKIIAAASASSTASFSSTGTLTLGGTSTGAVRFQGQLQELRLWSSSLNNSAFENHTKAPSAYNGNVDTYNELLFRLPLTQKINHSLTSSLNGYQPKISDISASFSGWSLNTPYDSIEETYYFDSISIGGSTYDDNKIRLESNQLLGDLDVKTRAERSQYDTAPMDSRKLGVYFSPQTIIDEDIISHYGFQELDNYIGDPGNNNPTEYSDLVQFAQSYWKKYDTKNDFNAYISIFSLFDMSFFKQLEQLLPARVDKITGILIQPNILERNKQNLLPVLYNFNDTYETIVTNNQPTASGDYLQHVGQISKDDLYTLNGNDDDQLQMYLTASNSSKYSGTAYSYQYISYTGSSFITSSTPYWMSEAISPVVLTNVTSEFRFKSGSTVYDTGSGGTGVVGVYGTGVLGTATYYLDPVGAGFTGILAEVQDFLPKSIANHRYNGCKLTSPSFNVNSTQTIDGGPVVSWQSANPAQLVYQTLGQEGSLVLTNNIKPQSIKKLDI